MKGSAQSISRSKRFLGSWEGASALHRANAAINRGQGIANLVNKVDQIGLDFTG
jgi:hypothetical protein